MSQLNSTGYTIRVAAILCFVCSLCVSAAAVILKPSQDKNVKFSQQKNILDATGLALGEFGRPADELSKEQVDELYGWISEKLVDLETGQYNTELDIENYDPLEALQKADMRVEITEPQFDPGEPYREKVAKVFFVTRPGESKVRQVVLPVFGKGLWGTLRGYLAIKSDLQTVQGLTFYEHKETPGLGGEVDNPRWKAQWVGRKLYDDRGAPAAMVYKGPAPSDDPHAVDGLSGATITSRGVTSLVRYWTSDDGYGPFLDQLKQELASGESASSNEAGAE